MRSFLIALSLLLSACAHDGIKPVRFQNVETVWEVSDKAHVDSVPSKFFPTSMVRHYDGYVYNRINRSLKVLGNLRSIGTNALDEVPNSTWFTNRIGHQTLTPQEVFDGPNNIGSPESHKPWTVIKAKVGGASIGFVVEDTRGVRFLLKFDQRGAPEVETGSDAITQRLIWAAGYNTPEDYIVNFSEAELILSEDTYRRDAVGKKTRLTRKWLRERLSKVEKAPDGRIRGLSSVFLLGELLGGHMSEGTRKGDVNDTIPHERRRELRGALPLFAWLDHLDVKDANAMDVYESDPDDPTRKYVMHYWLDFGKALGAHAQITKRKHFGYEYGIDFEATLTSALTLGLYPRAWANRVTPTIRGVGLYGSKSYDPEEWTPFFPTYMPFLIADEADGYWGAKLIMGFTKEHIAAAVRSARYSDPAATEYLTDALEKRKRKTAAYWFSQVSPLDRFSIKKGALCFSDLAVHYGLASLKKRVLHARSFDYEGKSLPWKWQAKSTDGEVCTSPLASSASASGYTVVKLWLSADSDPRPPVLVHLARNKQGTLRPIGIWRELP